MRGINKRKRNTNPPSLFLSPVKKIQSRQIAYPLSNTVIVDELIIIEIETSMMIYHLYLLNIGHLCWLYHSSEGPVVGKIEFLVEMDYVRE